MPGRDAITLGRQLGSSMTVMPAGSAVTSCSMLAAIGSMTKPRVPTCRAVVAGGTMACPGSIAAAAVPVR